MSAPAKRRGRPPKAVKGKRMTIYLTPERLEWLSRKGPFIARQLVLLIDQDYAAHHPGQSFLQPLLPPRERRCHRCLREGTTGTCIHR